MRTFFSFFLFWVSSAIGHSQIVCSVGSKPVFEMVGTELPALRGEAVFELKNFTLVIGGKFMDTSMPDSMGVYNCDVLLVDHKAKKTYTLPTGYFPPGVDDQFSGVYYCYTMTHDTAYIMGGYGYLLAGGYETTFDYMTIFSVHALIDSVLEDKSYYSLFEVVYDRNLAVMKGNMIRIGAYFLVFNGKEMTAIQDEFSDRIESSEWDFMGQIRKFRLKKEQDHQVIEEFQICTNAANFYQCMPAKWGPKSTTEW